MAYMIITKLHQPTVHIPSFLMIHRMSHLQRGSPYTRPLEISLGPFQVTITCPTALLYSLIGPALIAQQIEISEQAVCGVGIGRHPAPLPIGAGRQEARQEACAEREGGREAFLYLGRAPQSHAPGPRCSGR